MLAQITSKAVVGLDALPVTVEVDISWQGFPSFSYVGTILPDFTCDEAIEVTKIYSVTGNLPDGYSPS